MKIQKWFRPEFELVAPHPWLVWPRLVCRRVFWPFRVSLQPTLNGRACGRPIVQYIWPRIKIQRAEGE